MRALLCFLAWPFLAQADYGLSMYGTPKYSQDFSYFSTYNPEAPKGGDFRVALIGTYDTLNPFTIKGKCASSISSSDNLYFDPLMTRSPDEPFTVYGRLAHSYDMAPDRSWIIFHLRPEARFHDGSPITAEDVAFTFNLMKEKGPLMRRMSYKKVDKVEVLSPHSIKFTFQKVEGVYDREAPLLISLLQPLSKKSLEGVDFESTGLTPLVGSGPYRIKSFDAGRSIVFERDPNYWGKDLAVNKGLFNFDHIRFDYYQNQTAAFEAFKTGQADLWEETDVAKWASNFSFKAVKEGHVKKEAIKHDHQVGMLGFAFNLRNPLFQDQRVRQALTWAFDFNWLNKSLYHNAFKRTLSFFDNTSLSGKGSASPEVKALLEPYKKDLPATIFDAFTLPDHEDRRKIYHKSLALLKEAGWHLQKGQLVHEKTGQPFKFEILLSQPDNEKFSLAFARNLKNLGIVANVRTVEATQYEQRRLNHNYDMIVHFWGHTMTPGAEQALYWSSKAAVSPGSRNYPGIQNKVVDTLCQMIPQSKTYEELTTRIQALDKVLLSGYYIIPLFHKDMDYIAYWTHIDHPAFGTKGFPSVHSWWTAEKHDRTEKK